MLIRDHQTQRLSVECQRISCKCQVQFNSQDGWESQLVGGQSEPENYVKMADPVHQVARGSLKKAFGAVTWPFIQDIIIPASSPGVYLGNARKTF